MLPEVPLHQDDLRGFADDKIMRWVDYGKRVTRQELPPLPASAERMRKVN
jgi:hypothetical protein